jgi:asparagine synthase (glutamine-hydrolysing)
MSAICGLRHPDDRPVSPEEIERMNARALLLRPDAGGVWRQGPVGLGSRWRRTAPSLGPLRQPYCSREDDVALVLDGRIDNREDLLDRLPAGVDRAAPDEALLLFAYQVWGMDCLRQLAGDFAFAVWDGRLRRLLLARDVAGIRRFYYRATERTLSFASQLRQLLEPGESPAFDEEYFGLFLLDGLPPLSATPYAGIRRLPPGHRLVLQDGRFEVERYWRPEELPQIHYGTDDAYAEHFRDLFRRTVRAQLRADGPVWSELSGGLDSSSIVCTAQEIFRAGEAPDHSFATVTTVFDHTGPGDDPRYRRSVVEKYGIDSRSIVADLSPVFGDMAAGTAYWDEPHPQLRFFSFLQRYAGMLTKAGVEVLLAGNGAEVPALLEYPPPLHLADLLRSFRWGEFLREAQIWQHAFKLPLLNTLWTWGLSPLLRPPNRAYALEASRLPPWIAPGFAKKLDLRARANRGCMPKVFRSVGDQWQYEKLGRVCEGLYRGYLEYVCDIRYPFLSRPLLEYCLAIPYRRLLAPGEFKPILRRAMRRILPEEVRTRVDKGSVDKWVIQSLAQEWPRLEPVVRSPVLAELGFVDAAELHRSIHLFSYGRAERTALLSAIITLEVWVRSVLGERSVDTPMAAELPA